MLINNYNDFTTAMLDCGFSIGGGNNEGIFSLSSYFSENIKWLTENPDTDPWEWRIRVLDERNDIAYSKVFFKKSGYITKEWYPYFLAVRRGSMDFDDMYASGVLSSYAKRIYDVTKNVDTIPLHIIKQLANFSKDDKSKFERGLVELQMKLFITMCGIQQKTSQKGEEYGWSSTVFCTTERFWSEDVFAKAAKISEKEAIEKISTQIHKLNANAEQKKILKFIKG